MKGGDDEHVHSKSNIGSNSTQRRSLFSSTVMRPHGPILACDVAQKSRAISLLYNTHARSQINLSNNPTHLNQFKYWLTYQ